MSCRHVITSGRRYNSLSQREAVQRNPLHLPCNLPSVPGAGFRWLRPPRPPSPPPLYRVPVIRTGLFNRHTASERGENSWVQAGAGPGESWGTAGGPRCSFHAHYRHSSCAEEEEEKKKKKRGCWVHNNISAELWGFLRVTPPLAACSVCGNQWVISCFVSSQAGNGAQRKCIKIYFYSHWNSLLAL